MATFVTEVSNSSIKRYGITLFIWILIIILTSSGGSRLTNDVDSSAEFLEEDSESGAGFLAMEERFNISDEIAHIIVMSLKDTDQSVLSPEWRGFTLALTLRIQHEFATYRYDAIFSEPLLAFSGDPLLMSIASTFVSDDGKVGTINIISTAYDFETQQEDLRHHIEVLREILHDSAGTYAYAQGLVGTPFEPLVASLPSSADFDQAQFFVSGQVASFVDTLEVSESTFENSEVVAVILVIIILAIVFRSPLGIAIPIFAMVASLFPTYMVVYLLARYGVFSVSDFLPSIIAMIGIAVAIDYNLFSLVRYREEFRKRRAKHEKEGTWNSQTIKQTQVDASKRMNATAGQAVMYSGITVIIGFISFIVIGSEFTLGMAIGVSIVVVFSILTARTLTPAILSIFGRYLDWPNVLSRADQDVENQKDATENKERELQGFWVRWSKIVMRYPIQFLIVGLLFMTPFVILSTDVELSFDALKTLPDGTESREGLEIINEDFNLGTLQPYILLIDAGEVQNSIFNQAIIDVSHQIALWAYNFESSYNGVDLKFEDIRSITAATNATGQLNLVPLEVIVGGLSSLSNDTQFKRFAADFINLEFGNNTLIMEFGSNIDYGSAAAWEFAEIIRKEIAPILEDVDEIENYYLTGIAAAFNDTSDSMYDSVPLMVTIAVVLIYLALLILFRSVILPAKAILTIGGSILFGLGTLVYVFQYGNLSLVEIGGFTIWESEQAGVTFMIPVFIFTTILGLGMDYSIFIISRIKEETEKGEEISDAVGLGLAKTAGVVTSAATIMTVTFMVFALSPMLVLKTMGLALSVAIVVDATISRIILLPSAMKLAGKWNWWIPKWLEKILPRIDLEH